jgi:hypothetical protein
MPINTSNLFKVFTKKKQLLALFFLPLLFAITSLIIRKQHGTYWLGNNSDPEYAYLLNFLNITQLKTPGHTDHPGTPLQILGGIIIQITFLIQSLTHSVSSNIVEAVLEDPEFYLLIVNTVLLILTTVSLFLLGLTAFFLCQNLTLSLLVQLSPFLWTPLIQSIRVSPEPLLFCLTQLFVILLLFYLYSDVERSPRFALAIGVIFGLGVGTKVTFLPLGLVVFLLPGWRKKGLFLVTAIITFFLATIPIVSQYSRVFEWLRSIATHTGTYGGGNSGLVDVSALPNTFSDLLEKDSLFFYLIGLSALIFFIITFYFLLYGFKKTDLQNSSNFLTLKKSYSLFVCILLIILVQLLLTLKHPAIHYLLPAMGLCSLLVLVQVRLIGEILTPSSKYITAKNISFFAVGMYFILIINNTYGPILLLKQQSAFYFSEIETIHSLIRNEYNNCVHVRYYRSSDKEYALKFGDDFAANQYSQILQSIYPNGVFYNIWSKKYYSFDKELDSESLLNKKCIIFQGSPLKENIVIPEYLEFRKNMKVTPVFEGNEEALYLSCYEFKLHDDFAESFVTRGLSPLPVCVLDN